MDILDSAWLINMLKKSGRLPQQRLLSLFDILADWSDAPNVRTQGNLSTNSALQPGKPSVHAELSTRFKATGSPDHLLDYLAEEARASGAQLPEALARQLYFIALCALQESMQASEDGHYGHHHFGHAKRAAQALIAAQTEQETAKKPLTKTLVYGIAAGMAVMAIAAGLLLHGKTSDIRVSTVSAPSNGIQPVKQGYAYLDAAEDAPSPKLAAEMYAAMEQMRKGDCHYVEVLQIPDTDKKVYIENVVGGRVPDNARDMALAQKYLQKISCSYTPILMKNSVN